MWRKHLNNASTPFGVAIHFKKNVPSHWGIILLQAPNQSSIQRTQIPIFLKIYLSANSNIHKLEMVLTCKCIIIFIIPPIFFILKVSKLLPTFMCSAKRLTQRLKGNLDWLLTHYLTLDSISTICLHLIGG